MSIEKMKIGIEIKFSDMKIIEIEVNFVYRNITNFAGLLKLQYSASATPFMNTTLARLFNSYGAAAAVPEARVGGV
jgi:hypothetical protein